MRALFLVLIVTGSVFGDDPREPTAREKLEAVGRAYRLQVDVADPKFPVKCEYGVIGGIRANDRDLASYAELFVPEFSLYPRDLVVRTKLKRLVFCEKLSFDGEARNAIPDYENDTLYYDVSSGNYSPSYMKLVIHHEFFHVVDYLDDGLVYEDATWSGFNPADFRYGSGGPAGPDDSETSLLTDRFPGFLTHYATTGVQEDKAELFGHLILHPRYVDQRMEKEPLLKTKVSRMKTLLGEFCPEVNDDFWTRARALRTEKESAAREGDVRASD
jgi:hypothetical protein